MSFLCTTRNKEVSYHQCLNECQYFFKNACIDKMNEAYQQGRAEAEETYLKLITEIDLLNASDMSEVNLYKFACRVKEIADALKENNNV